MLAQVGAAVEAPEHLVDARKHVGVVRVRPHEAEHLVQSQDLVRGTKARASELTKELGLRRRRVFTELVPCALQPKKERSAVPFHDQEAPEGPGTDGFATP